MKKVRSTHLYQNLSPELLADDNTPMSLDLPDLAKIQLVIEIVDNDVHTLPINVCRTSLAPALSPNCNSKDDSILGIRRNTQRSARVCTRSGDGYIKRNCISIVTRMLARVSLDLSDAHHYTMDNK